ncbi:MAG: hypothetical protein LBG57_09210 [Treponema sp.]|jgi:hypothetical protein|nr:hypothetical protein [Treponema sp.]
MVNSASYSKVYRIESLVLTFFCLLAVSCDFPQGFGKEKGSLTITLPGANVPAKNLMAARAVHLPEPVTGDMSHTLDFYNSGGSFSVGPTRKKLITVDLEPGYWDIVVTAWYGSDMVAFDKKPQVEIRAGQANSVSFTMNADDFVTPDLSGAWVNQNKNLTTSDSPVTLAITLAGATAFSGISGWTDSFTYQKYYEDAGGTRTNIDASPVSFSGPGTTSLSYTVDPAVLGLGTFNYYAEVSNTYAYTSGSGTVTDTAKKNIYVANVTVVGSTSYSVGDTGPGGGKIFYVSPAGFTSNGVTCHYLEATVSDLGPAEWGANGTAIGTGYTNTQTIITALSSGTPESGRAAQLAAAYNGGGFTDWFLPSQDELQELYQSGLTGLSPSIWSSTEDSVNQGRSCGDVGSGFSAWDDLKTTSLGFRPIRAF